MFLNYLLADKDWNVKATAYLYANRHMDKVDHVPCLGILSMVVESPENLAPPNLLRKSIHPFGASLFTAKPTVACE
jgi:hypothetical protein